MLSKELQAELDNLHGRHLYARRARTSKPKEEPKPEPAKEPEIHVHVDVPEVKPCATKKWVFKHKYDVYNKLIETTATCE